MTNKNVEMRRKVLTKFVIHVSFEMGRKTHVTHYKIKHTKRVKIRKINVK